MLPVLMCPILYGVFTTTLHFLHESTRRGVKGTHLSRPVFPEEKANYISLKATKHINKQSSDERPRIRLSPVCV